MRQRIEPQCGVAFELPAGHTLRVIDPDGEQVADLIAFSRASPGEWLSSGRTLDYNDTIYLTTGHMLYSNRSTAMLAIVEDTVGRHDFLYTPCSPETFSIIYKTTGHHPSCFENLAGALRPYGIEPDRIPTTFNIFMNVDVGRDGTLAIHPPRSKPGDSITLRAEMDLVVGLTACSAEMSNNYRFKPIEFAISGPGETSPPLPKP
ncbi:MAG TPA: urea carboxylase-associated family protein [Vicinamibacterales bacterium]|nr:urea carboxylase-associated family protein [Vicinamibacterales bacterium]